MNVMTSGRSFGSRDEATMDTMVRYILLNSMIFLGGTLLFLFGFESLRAGATVQGFFDLSMGFMTLVAFVVLRTEAPFVVSGLLTVIPYMMLCGFLAVSGGVQGSGVLWIYSFPLLSIFLLGMKAGTALSIVLLAGVAAAVYVPGVSPMTFEPSFAHRTVGVYVLVLVCTMVYERTKVAKDQWVARLTRELKAERDEIAAMKDNLKTGLFLMDRDFVIQPQYSRALESIIGEADLSGRNFLDLLKNSVQEKEHETLRDYFEMVFNKSYDAQMLEDINPLHEFTYVGIASGKTRTLRCTFAPIDRDDGKSYILGTLDDQTQETELRQQLSEEEGKRQEEMRALFEVIHVEPRVLNDFIADAEYEFDRINAAMKDKTRAAPDVVSEIYQGVHAIKSNAVILGLSSFSTKLHQLEDEIRDLREHADVSFQEILHITVELDKLMTIKDGFKGLIHKILSFNTGESRLQEEHVIVQSLQRVIDKAAADLGKRAKLAIRSIDPRAIERAPRRVVKDVLVQLVRNAMSHGIESPLERSQAGKGEEGLVSLAIGIVDDRIEIALTDDGKGLDFSAISAKARDLGLITDPARLSDRNSLLQVLFSPGFSTAKSTSMHAGRGVGLSYVRDRVRELKGSIRIQSEDGKGTTFRVTLPAELAAREVERTA